MIKYVTPRPTIEIHLPGGRTIEGPRNAAVGELLSIIDDKESPIVGALINHELRELTYPIRMDSEVVPITMSDEDGMRIYRRTLTFLLEVAFEEEFPGAELAIDHSVAAGGYFCEVRGSEPLTMETLARVETRMKNIATQNLQIKKGQVPIKEAIAFFEQRGFHDKVLLLAHRKRTT